jgi:hypothetical protein
MLNRKLLEVLGNLTAAEKKQLRLFLLSPFFNHTVNADEIVRLYDYVIRHDARHDAPAMAKEVVFREFYPDLPFHENAKTPLDALASELFGLVRRFLAQMESDKSSGELAEYMALARFYRKFAFEERYRHTMQVMRKKQQESPVRDASYYYQQFKLEEEELSFRGMYNTFEDSLNLKAINHYLDLYYSSLKLEYDCHLEHQKRFIPVQDVPDVLLVNTIRSLAEDGGPISTPVNRIYLLLHTMLQNPDDDENFGKWESLLAQYESTISKDRYKDLMSFYRVVWHLKYSKSGDDFSRSQIFNINRLHLKNGYLYFDNLIPHTTFRNLVIFGLKIREFDWVKQFLKNHPPERIGGTRYPAEIYNLNLAEYYFAIKKYEEASEKLVYRPFEHPTISILADMLLIKIYFETQNDLLEARMNALDQKIRRSRLGRETKIRYYNFLKKLDKVIKYGRQPQSTKRARLAAQIRTMPDIIAREWLLEQLNR